MPPITSIHFPGKKVICTFIKYMNTLISESHFEAVFWGYSLYKLRYYSGLQQETDGTPKRSEDKRNLQETVKQPGLSKSKVILRKGKEEWFFEPVKFLSGGEGYIRSWHAQEHSYFQNTTQQGERQENKHPDLFSLHLIFSWPPSFAKPKQGRGILVNIVHGRQLPGILSRERGRSGFRGEKNRRFSRLPARAILEKSTERMLSIKRKNRVLSGPLKFWASFHWPTA